MDEQKIDVEEIALKLFLALIEKGNILQSENNLEAVANGYVSLLKKLKVKLTTL